MQDSIAKEKKWSEKMSGNFAIKGGGAQWANLGDEATYWDFSSLMKVSNYQASLLYAFQCAVGKGGMQERTKGCFQER